MSYQEGRTVANIVSGIAIIIAYCVYALGKTQAGNAVTGDLKFWAVSMLVFIGIGIVLTIVVQILFHIVLSITIAVKKREYSDREIEKDIEATVIEDEMDKLIELKAMKTGFAVSGIGFVTALLLAVFSESIGLMINTLFLSFSIGSIVEGFASLYYYRKGVKNG
jgi:hypothetical protein